MIRQAPTFAKHVAMMAVAATAGKIVARKVRGTVFNRQPGTLAGSAIEAAIGVGGGLALSGFNAVLGEGFAIGGLQAPLETFIQQKQVKGVSDALADDGYYIGGNTGVGVVSAFPDDYSNTVGDVGGYVAGAERGGSDIVAGYLQQIDANAA